MQPPGGTSVHLEKSEEGVKGEAIFSGGENNRIGRCERGWVITQTGHKGKYKPGEGSVNNTGQSCR